MSTPESNGWIAFKDASPRDSEFPPKTIWIWAIGRSRAVLWDMDAGAPANTGWTHWQPANVPEPPKIELTRAELDSRAFAEWEKQPANQLNIGRNGEAVIWRAALAWERMQVSALVEAIRRDPERDAMFDPPALAQLAKRVGLKPDDCR